MKFLRVGFAVAFAFSFITTHAPTVSADTTGGVVISQVQVGSSSNSRLVEIYNNSGTDIDVTGWCVKYVTASGTVSNRACFAAATAVQRLVLPAKSYVLVGSSQLNIAADYVMAEGLGTGTVGSVYLTDQSGQPKDIFGWGATSYAEGLAKASDSVTKVYERKQVAPGVYSDENANSTDFFNSTLRPSYQIKALVEVDDVCLNIGGIQQLVPEGLMLDVGNQCVAPPVDICENIDGIQTILPNDTEVDASGQCYMDACLNLLGFQELIPLGYVQGDGNICVLSGRNIEITEVLPNPEGEDAGNEFIEFYNPNDGPVNLTYHTIHLNGDYIKSYYFKPGTIIEPRSYLVTKNADTIPAFTLTNSQGDARLRAHDGATVAEVPAYTSAASGESWAIVNDVWQYTPLVTPGDANKLPLVGQGFVAATSTTDCGEGRERNPATNRCRNIPVASTLAACKEGQYRSEETNRCRSIAATVNALKPCAENQFRNPTTNRCRNIASSDDPTDCGEGRERNPKTNRCRNVLGATAVPDSAFKVEPIKESPVAFVGWWALGGVVAVAVGYAGWEWRREISSSYGALVSRFSGRR